MTARWRCVAALALGGLLAAAPSASAIVGGRPAVEPRGHQAALYVRGAFRCGATLVAARFVLTAAHCVVEADGRTVPASDVAVGFGRSLRSQLVLADFLPGAAVDRHPGSQAGAFANDVAVVRLTRPVGFEPLPLVTAGQQGLFAGGVPATILGWGATQFRGPQTDELREAQIPVISDSDCAAAYAALGGFDAHTMVCAGSIGGIDPCHGDSGGPLIVGDAGKPALAGVISWTVGCARADYPAGFARVGGDSLAGWLRARVPQADFTVAPAAPAAQQQVTLTSTSRNPVAGYATLQWDLDNDGAFDDAGGATAAATFAPGAHVVGLRASSAQGDSEVRRRGIVAAPASAVTLAAPVSMRVREGSPIALTLLKDGASAGAVTATPQAGSARLRHDLAGGPIHVPFAAGDRMRAISVSTVSDRIMEPTERATVALTAATGGLAVGTPATVTVTIVDDDLRIRLIRTRRGLVVRTATRVPGRFVLRARARHGGRRVLASARRSVRRPGPVSLPVHLTRAGRRAARGSHRGTLARFVVEFRPRAGRDRRSGSVVARFGGP